MIIVLLIFLCLYSGINFYAFFQAKNVFHFSGTTEIVIITLLIFLILAPIIIRIIEKFHRETLARSIAYLGYFWMAFVFLFFFLNITLDTVRYVFCFFYQSKEIFLLKNIFFSLAVFLSIIFVVYGFFDARRIRVKKLEIHTDKSLSNNGKIRIVQISDVHIGLIIRNKRLKVILDRVKEEKPDILVSTGDLLDGELSYVTPEAVQLAEIKPMYGKYAIPGNHEYYAGIEEAMEFTKSAGFEILRDKSRQVAGINIIGRDDITGRKLGLIQNSPHLSELLPATPGNAFILLLKHQPAVHEDANFNLQLSGHTHNGQIFPFKLVTRLFFHLNHGYYKLGENKSVYVTSGAGTWGPPVRLFAPPEITVIDLIGKKGN
ncbi:MAG TPA: metallophosphoesterase [Smithella sp.]|nr:metallophosphoesterase [Smithella sp.]